MSAPATPARGLALLLTDGQFDRLHAAFMLAAAALAMGRPVLIFAMGPAVSALCADWSALSGIEADLVLKSRGVADFETLRDAVIELEATLMACDSGMHRMALEPASLLPEVKISGLVSFLDQAEGREIVSF